MRLQTSSRLVRWAYLFNKHTPYRTSLCAFFWRCVLLTPFLCAVIAAIVGGVLGFVGYLVWTHPNRVALVTSIILSALAALYATRWAEREGHLARMGASVQGTIKRISATPSIQSTKRNVTILWRGAKAIKAKVCPVIVLTNDTEPADLDVVAWN